MLLWRRKHPAEIKPHNNTMLLFPANKPRTVGASKAMAIMSTQGVGLDVMVG